MDYKIPLQEIKTPEDVAKLTGAFSELAEDLDILYTESSLNGSISARKGRIALYKNGSNYELWVNTDGSTTWQQFNTFLSLLDTPSSFSGVGGKKVAVNAGATALEFVDITDTDEKAKVSSNDTTAGYLNGKLVAGTNVTLTENTDGGNETLGIATTDTNTSNVIFSWSGMDNYNAADPYRGAYLGNSLAASGAEGAGYFYVYNYSTTYATVLNFQFKKIAGISTITICARIWSSESNSTREALLKVDIGGANATVKSVTSTTPTWVTTANIDVSLLINGTVYDGVVQLANESTYWSYCSAITLIAS